jgi:hypothetical protein
MEMATFHIVDECLLGENSIMLNDIFIIMRPYFKHIII